MSLNPNLWESTNWSKTIVKGEKIIRKMREHEENIYPRKSCLGFSLWPFSLQKMVFSATDGWWKPHVGAL